MVVKTDVILERLKTLDEYIRLLEPYRAWSIRRLKAFIVYITDFLRNEGYLGE
jgi:hypothetical protein